MKNPLLKEIALSEAGLIFNPVTGESFSVNPIGVSILNYLKKGLETHEICKLLAEEYNVDLAVAERDIIDFMSLLKHHKLAVTHEQEN